MIRGRASGTVRRCRAAIGSARPSTRDLRRAQFCSELAERGGFEPPIGLHLCRISSAVHSTALPPLQASVAALRKEQFQAAAQITCVPARYKAAAPLMQIACPSTWAVGYCSFNPRRRKIIRIAVADRGPAAQGRDGGKHAGSRSGRAACAAKSPAGSDRAR